MRILDAIYVLAVALIVGPLYLLVLCTALLFCTVGGWIVLITAAIVTVGVAL